MGRLIPWVGRQKAATLVVAASNASARAKARADYLCDGTDDDVQIQAAVNALPAVSGKVLLTEGTFSISTPISVLKHNVTIEGQGPATDIQAAAGAEGIDILRLGDGGVTTYANLRVANLRVSAAAQKTANTGIKINKCFKVWLDKVYVEWQYRAVHLLNSTQIWMDDLPIRNTKENGITIESAF